MEETKIINGSVYTFEVPENLILAREIAAQELKGYKIGHETDGYRTYFYFVCNTHFTKIKKCIGRLYYDNETSKFSLYKDVEPKNHIHNKSNCVGVNGVIFAKLRVGDYIYFNIGQKHYKIRVEKAIKTGHYYTNTDKDGLYSELQFFIPIQELKEIEIGQKSTRKARARA